jgi:rod shape-determining protein MreD
VLFVVGRALSGGPTAGIAWGFGIGLLIDAISGTQLGLGAFAYTMAGFVSGQFSSEKGTSRTRFISALAFGAVLSFTFFMYFKEPWDQIGWMEPFLLRVLPGAFYTWFVGLVWVHSPFAHLRAGKGRA